jgi:hypothetical protein
MSLLLITPILDDGDSHQIVGNTAHLHTAGHLEDFCLQGIEDIKIDYKM